MSLGKAAVGVVLAVSVVAPTIATADADARPPAKHSHARKAHAKRNKIVKRRTANGYRCHTHRFRAKPHKGTDWSSRKVHGKSFTHCHKIKPKRPKHRSGGSSAWVLPRYVVMCESGGNPTAVNLTSAGIANGVPSGLYQITRPTWLAYGGGAFASEARFASVYEQGIIAKRVLAGQGPRAWACW